MRKNMSDFLNEKVLKLVCILLELQCGVSQCDFVRVKIFDDDVDFKTLLPENINNTLDDDIGDDNPAVAEFVDERPQHVKELERFRQSKQWKLVSQKPGSQLFSLNLMLFQ